MICFYNGNSDSDLCCNRALKHILTNNKIQSIEYQRSVVYKWSRFYGMLPKVCAGMVTVRISMDIFAIGMHLYRKKCQSKYSIWLFKCHQMYFDHSIDNFISNWSNYCNHTKWWWSICCCISRILFIGYQNYNICKYKTTIQNIQFWKLFLKAIFWKLLIKLCWKTDYQQKTEFSARWEYVAAPNVYICVRTTPSTQRAVNAFFFAAGTQFLAKQHWCFNPHNKFIGR